MTDRPIIFSAPMVRALLDGRKTQTRRKFEIKAGYRDPLSATPRLFESRWQAGGRLWVREAHAFVPASAYRNSLFVEQRADPSDPDRAAIYREGFDRSTSGIRWRSPIHMPRWASRLTLLVTDVRVQRVQEISEADAVAEGALWQDPSDEDREWARRYAEENGGSPEIEGVWIVPGTRQGYGPTAADRARPIFGPTAAFAFRMLWNSLHGPDAWGENRWVAAVSFDVHRCNIDQMEDA